MTAARVVSRRNPSRHLLEAALGFEPKYGALQAPA